jgi:CBS domain-containing protein
MEEETQMRVDEIMSCGAKVIEADASVADAAREMRACVVGALPVLSGERLLGVVTDRDVMERIVATDADPRTTRVQEVMTPGPLTCHPDEDVDEVVERMLDGAVRRLVVIERHSEHVVGMLTVDDLALASEPRWAIAVLRRTMLRRDVELDGVFAEP